MTAVHGFRIVDVTPLLTVAHLTLESVVISGPGGDRHDRVVVRHPGAVAVVPRIGTDVILIAQYRAAVDRVVLEIPAGKLDIPGEDPVVAARRELTEETGFTASGLDHLIDIDTSVGFTDERIGIYLATDLRGGTPHPVGAEEMAAEIVRIPWSDAMDAVMSGHITDAKTVAGLLAADRPDGTP